MAIDARFQEQARAFIVETMKQAIPTLNVDGGSGVNAVLGRGASVIAAPLLQEIEHVTSSRDLTDPESLSTEDMDLLLDNLLVDRDQGDRSFGFVRLYYTARAHREFSGLVAQTEDGSLNFVTLTDLVFEPQDHFVDANSGLFYINVPMVGEKAGEEYNVDVGEITKLTNDTSGPSRITNPDKFRAGKTAQTNTEALRLAQRSISTRTPLAKDGAIFFLQQLFGTKLLDLLVVGFGDEEMTRDELYDMGPMATPRFQIGKDGLGGTPQNAHVGGRTDIYALLRTINYVQQQVDIFADMLLDSLTPIGTTTIIASFAAGTTGVIALGGGKLILDLGKATEETVVYTAAVAIDNDTYQFTCSATTISHAAASSVKVVNNGRLAVGPSADIRVLPVFQVAEVRLLDPVTFEPVGDPLTEVTPHDGSVGGDKTPGWYIADATKFDILSGREEKTIVIDEKRSVLGNAALSGTNGATATVVVGGGSYTRYTKTGVDFTGYQGREITLSGAVTGVRRIIDVLSPTQVLLSGAPLTVAGSGVNFAIAAAYGDFNEFPVRVSYYTNTEIQEIQSFLDQDKKRTIAGDSLARMFMPVFLDFTLRYRGDGEELDVRKRILDILQTSAGEALGESTGAKFEYSDLINAAYTDGLANYVVTPFQIKIRRLNVDGTVTTKWLHPSPDTYNDLAVRIATVANGTFVEARRPTGVPAFTVPTQGKLYLGGFTSNQEVVEYTTVIVDGDNYTFVLREGTTLGATPHNVDEPMKVSTIDFDPANVITDGIITDERTYRPFLGNVIIERI